MLHSFKRVSTLFRSLCGKVSIFYGRVSFLGWHLQNPEQSLLRQCFDGFSNKGRKPVFLNWLLRSSALAGTRNSQLVISCHRINNNAVALFCGEVKCLVLIQQREPFVDEQEVTFP